jgi:hypothetical protein
MDVLTRVFTAPFNAEKTKAGGGQAVGAEREDAKEFVETVGSTVDAAGTVVATTKVTKIEGAVGKDSEDVAKVKGAEGSAAESVVKANLALESSREAEVGAIQGSDRGDVGTKNETGTGKQFSAQPENVDCTEREENEREDSALLDIHWLIIKPALGMAQRGILVPH